MQQKKQTELKAMKIQGLSKKYKRSKDFAISDLNFAVNAGSFHGFIGANGAGKTTTIKSLVGAYAKFSGKIEIFGKKHSTIEAKKLIGYIPENTNFPKGLNTFQFIYYLSQLAGLNKKSAKNHTIKILEDTNLKNMKRRNPNNFSSGQKKRVLLAQALVHNPNILIMDEPAANLDPKARDEFFNTLKKLQKNGKTIFISSHILAELDSYVDSLTIIDSGKIVYNGNIETLRTDEEFKYQVKLQNNKVLDEIILELKLTKSGDLIDFKNQKNLDAFSKQVLKAKTNFITFNLFKKSLQDIYNEKVKTKTLVADQKGGK